MFQIHCKCVESIACRLSPPYMPNVNPTELVNSQLKQQLKSRSIDEQMTTLNDKQASQLLVQQIGDILANHISIDNVENYYRKCGWH